MAPPQRRCPCGPALAALPLWPRPSGAAQCRAGSALWPRWRSLPRLPLRVCAEAFLQIVEGRHGRATPFLLHIKGDNAGLGQQLLVF